MYPYLLTVSVSRFSLVASVDSCVGGEVSSASLGEPVDEDAKVSEEMLAEADALDAASLSSFEASFCPSTLLAPDFVWSCEPGFSDGRHGLQKQNNRHKTHQSYF